MAITIRSCVGHCHGADFIDQYPVSTQETRKSLNTTQHTQTRNQTHWIELKTAATGLKLCYSYLAKTMGIRKPVLVIDALIHKITELFQDEHTRIYGLVFWQMVSFVLLFCGVVNVLERHSPCLKRAWRLRAPAIRPPRHACVTLSRAIE